MLDDILSPTPLTRPAGCRRFTAWPISIIQKLFRWINGPDPQERLVLLALGEGKKDITDIDHYKVHLAGYNQIDLITGKGPSRRHEVFYFAEGTLGAVRIDNFKYRFIEQPSGWFGGTVKLDVPILVNLRLDPFERTGLTGSVQNFDWFKYEFWRFV